MMIYHARMQGDVQARLVSVGKVEVQRERCGRQCSCCCDSITTSRGEQQREETRAQTLQTLNTWRLIVVCYHAFRKASACVPHRVLAANACAAHSALASSFTIAFALTPALALSLVQLLLLHLTTDASAMKMCCSFCSIGPSARDPPGTNDSHPLPSAITQNLTVLHAAILV